MIEDKPANLQRLLTHYYKPENDIFLHPNTPSILEAARENADYALTTQDIEDFRASLYQISRSIENRELRGKKRYESGRCWQAYAPGKNIPNTQYPIPNIAQYDPNITQYDPI